MKLAAFSDPHSDINSKRFDPNYTTILTDYISDFDPDVVLIAGDISGSSKELIKFFEEFQIDCHKLFVPGNHDLWVSQNSENGSWAKYFTLIPEICETYGWHYLPNNPIQIENTAFIGNTGWYDYSTRNEKWDNEISKIAYEKKTNPFDQGVWMDKAFAKFGDLHDQEVAEYFLLELQVNLMKAGLINVREINSYSTLLEKIKSILKKGKFKFDTKKIEPTHQEFEGNIENLVFASHIVPFKKFVKFRDSIRWDYFSAFIGNSQIGDLMSSIHFKGRKISIFGHTHYPQQSIIRQIEAYCVPIGYNHEWKFSNLNKVFSRRIKILEI
ncbi:MAG: metallophosphoesterase [Candidatus Heimdallarchaeota archaeon]|nr:metallophosphoesterase [Candidatus Heimdallarchaeota archaeon]